MLFQHHTLMTRSKYTTLVLIDNIQSILIFETEREKKYIYICLNPNIDALIYLLIRYSNPVALTVIIFAWRKRQIG
jgi:hypothetical protein